MNGELRSQLVIWVQAQAIRKSVCIFATMPAAVVDYEKTVLRKGGSPIAWPRVVGVAVEKAFKKADQALGVGCLEPHHLDGRKL